MRPVKRALKMLESPEGNTKEEDQVQQTRQVHDSDDVTKIQTTKLSILQRFYFLDVSEQLKTNIHPNFCFERVLGFVIECARISKLLRDAAFT